MPASRVRRVTGGMDGAMKRLWWFWFGCATAGFLAVALGACLLAAALDGGAVLQAAWIAATARS